MISLIWLFVFSIFFFISLSFPPLHYYGFHSSGMAFNIQVDFISITFFTLLIIISSIVLVWSYYYCNEEINFKLFFLLVLSFITSILFLIFFGDMALILLGWDGLGITSFLLVIFYKNRKRLGSGLLTVILNRRGDCFFLLLLAFRLGNGGMGGLCPTGIVILILLSITKSAQFPFRSWLPAAMAAPTPVSALVHSSTLVTAGVFILLRFSRGLPFYWLLFVGSLTLFLAGLSAFFENDIKKIVALSTLSQLGVIIVSISIGLCDFTFFHLCTHALFKALIFLCVGVAIHSVWGSQDLRSYGSLSCGIVYPYVFLILARASFLGFPPGQARWKGRLHNQKY